MLSNDTCWTCAGSTEHALLRLCPLQHVHVFEEASLIGHRQIERVVTVDCAVQAFLETLDSWTKCGLQSSQMSPYPEFRSCARIPYSSLSKIPWSMPIIGATTRHPRYLFTMVSFWSLYVAGGKRRRIRYTCYFSMFLLDVFVKSAHATASGCVPCKDIVVVTTRHSLCRNPGL